MKQMRFLLFTVLLSTLSFNSTADTAKKKPAPPEAAKKRAVASSDPCPHYEDTFAALNSLNYQVNPHPNQPYRDADRDKGRLLAGQVEECINAFPENSADDQQFYALIKLIALALPYDESTDLAYSAGQLGTDPRFQKYYSEALKEIPDECNRKYLTAAAAYRECSDSAEAGNCPSPINYDKCRKLSPTIKR